MSIQKRTIFWGVLAIAGAVLFMMAGPAAFSADAKDKPAITTTDFDDWRMECQTKNGQKICHAFQQVINKSTKKTVLAAIVTVYKTQKAGETVTMLNFIGPLGTRLASGMAVQFDSDKQMNVPYQICTPIGCSVNIKIGNDLAPKIRSGKLARVAYQRMGAKGETFGVSLKGLGKAIDALTRNTAG
jgi:invasion protein IalB